MAVGAPSEHDQVPEAGERLHIPGPSYLPAILAFGATIAIVGVVISPVILILGSIVTLIALVRWVKEARAEMSELSLEH